MKAARRLRLTERKKRGAKPRIHLLVPALELHDAIGHDVLGMREVLAQEGYPVSVFAEGWNPALNPLVTRPDPRNTIWQDPNALLIYHHSTRWERGEELLSKAANRVVIRYHNVTPPSFFEPYSEAHVKACQGGLESTRKLARLPGAWYWNDSFFNASEMVANGASWDRCRTLAPLHRIEQLTSATPDLSLYEQLEHKTVIIFTGGLKPNKGHRSLIETFARYHRTRNPRSVLLLVGGFPDRLRGYVEELRRLTEQLDVADAVIFTGSVSEHQLRLYYQMADVLLCASEHEGFCVPLVEAMAFRVPIVAGGGTAIPETVGRAGLVFDQPYPETFCEALDYLDGNPEIAAELGWEGYRRYQSRYAPAVLAQRLMGLVEEMTGHATVQ